MRELLSVLTPYVLPELVDARVDLGRFVAVQMIGEMVKNPADMIGPRRPVADPGRELVVRGDLDTIIATGLGLDLAAVRKTSEQIGIVAAVAQAQVPLASKDGNVVFDKQTIAGMRGALADELARTLGVAAPQGVLRTTRAKTARTARVVAPDPLDALIARNEPEDDEEDLE